MVLEYSEKVLPKCLNCVIKLKNISNNGGRGSEVSAEVQISTRGNLVFLTQLKNVPKLLFLQQE